MIDNLPVGHRSRVDLERRTGIEVIRQNGRQNVVVGVLVGDEVTDAALDARHDVDGDRTGEIVDHGSEHAPGIVIEAQRALCRIETHRDVLLRRHGQRGGLLRGVLRADGRTRHHSVVVRQADSQLRALLRATNGKRVIILHVHIHHECVGVFPEANGLPSNHIEGENRVSHDCRSYDASCVSFLLG